MAPDMAADLRGLDKGSQGFQGEALSTSIPTLYIAGPGGALSISAIIHLNRETIYGSRK